MSTTQSITLTFDFQINDSVQIGDTAYYTPQSAVGPNSTGGEIVVIGEITAISENSITCNIASNTVRPTSLDFILFSKDNAVNMASPLGYYALVNLKNNDTSSAEIFSVGSEVFESSK
jgi:hypothetical protein